MLHEVLLALSGHPSPLFEEQQDGRSPAQDDLLLLSPSERALLRNIGRLSELHRRLRHHLEAVCASHQSIICRSVATSIHQTHLRRFQQRILDVESRILKRDAHLVGAYKIVPLASIVGEFDDWHRLMAWYWEIVSFIQPPESTVVNTTTKTATPCTGALLTDRLRAESQTGYPEIEAAATELTVVAETAWLRQLSSWLVYGNLPSAGAQDFFIRSIALDQKAFRLNEDLLPSFVNASTAVSIMFIGKCLHQMREHERADRTSFARAQLQANRSEMANQHLRYLSALELPMVASQFSRTISDIRLSLSRKVLQHLLPIESTLRVLSCLQQFFFLSRGEFALVLISEAEARMATRQQQQMGRLMHQNPVKALQGLSIKDAELHQVLQRVWKEIAANGSEDDDDVLEYARSHISLSTPKGGVLAPESSESVYGTPPEMTPIAFNDLLFPTPSELTLAVFRPLDLFLSSHDVSTYSSISSYLMAIERGYQRLSGLWRRSAARRDHPISTANDSASILRTRKRAIATRKIWATCSAAHFLLSETAAFFEGEVVKGSCNHFQSWVSKATSQDISRPTTFATTHPESERSVQRDPETLAVGHRTFLASLTYALLLTDTPYTKELRSLLGNVDQLIAFFTRQLDLQQRLDLQEQAEGEGAHLVEEEQNIALELDRARKRVDSDSRSVVNRLRQLNQERIGSLRYLDVAPSERGDFEIWKGGGVDRLLMKLEFGRMANENFDIV